MTMSDDMKHASDELFATEGDDGNRTDDDSTSEESQEDENHDSLPRLKAEKEFAESWANKISLGKASLEELSEKQPWLVPKVKELLQSNSANVDHDEIKRLAMEAAKELIQEERAKEKAKSDSDKFEALRKELEKNATSQQKKFIKAKYDALLEKKLDPYDALSLAAEIADVDFEGVADNKAKFPQIKLGESVATTQDEIDYDTYDPNSVPLAELQRRNAKKYGGGK